MVFGRRDFLRLGAATSLGGISESFGSSTYPRYPNSRVAPEPEPTIRESRLFNTSYSGDFLSEVSFPLGGIGSGMICIDGPGSLSKFSVRNCPDLVTCRRVFAAIALPGNLPRALVVEGPVPECRLKPDFPGKWGAPPNVTWGLPRFRGAQFEGRFPFANIRLSDPDIPLTAEISAWSPFSPPNADDSSLPVAALEYRFTNQSGGAVKFVFSFNSENFLVPHPDPSQPTAFGPSGILPTRGGFILGQHGTPSRPWDEGQCAIWLDEPEPLTLSTWFNGAWYDQTQVLWREILSGETDRPSPTFDPIAPGASLFLPVSLHSGESRTLTLRMAWYVPQSSLFEPDFRFTRGRPEPLSSRGATYRPWYAARFSSLDEVVNYWRDNYRRLKDEAQQFSAAFFSSTLPPEVMEAVAANLTILKSPTLLRQTDGRLWSWEGIFNTAGSCYGTSNHVWNYAQTLAHLFPSLERSLRETELGPDLGTDGFEAVRTALPIRPVGDTREDGFGFPAAADGQLGVIIKLYRDWRISGDTDWVRSLWPKAVASLDYCIATWDPRRRGRIEEPHLNTYDVMFWGTDSLCNSLYLGALKAAIAMGDALGHQTTEYKSLLERSRQETEGLLFNGEFFLQKVDWHTLRAQFPPTGDDPLSITLATYADMLKLSDKEGPPYQYGSGCLSDGVFGAWLCLMSGIDDILDRDKIESHLLAVHRYNFKKSLYDHANQFRSFLACGNEGGLLICSWPDQQRPILPLAYADEVWTGIEYEVASHLIALGHLEEGLEIVRTCRRRYDGRVRNPFSEVEAGQWYVRAMASYALLQAVGGARFDAVNKVLYLKPVITGDYRCFLSTATGYGIVGVTKGRPFVEVVSGSIPYERILYQAA
jgi:uncharacterized protein (DUF608 family)